VTRPLLSDEVLHGQFGFPLPEAWRKRSLVAQAT
jgi:hypothetical protein